MADTTQPQPPVLATDAAAHYTAYRAELPDEAAGDALLQQLANRNAATPPPTAPSAAGTPVAPATAPQVTPGAPNGHSLPYRVGADMLEGAVETPRAIATGVGQGLSNTYDAIDDFAQWAGDKISHATGYYGIHVGKDGIHMETPQGAATDIDPATAARTVIDKKFIADPQSETGQLVKGVTQFVTGMAVASTGMGAVGLPTEAAGAAGYALNAAKGAVANFAAFDPHQQRLSNLIERFPELSNPVTRYLAARPDDNAAEGRFKNAIEGLGLGTLADGFVKSVRVLRGVMDAKASGAAPALQGAAEATPGLDETAFRGLGDETQPAQAPLLRRNTTVEGTPSAPLAPLEDRFRAQLEGDYEGAKAQYNALDAHGVDTQGGKVLSTDAARELSPEYAASKDTRSALAAEVHEPASAFVKKYYAEKLQEAPKEGEEPLVMFTAGGTGAGKTSAIESIPAVKDMADRAQIVYDTNLNNFDSAKGKIDQALEAGKQVHIAYVYRDPEEALTEGTLPRAEKYGRTVPIENHVETHAGAYETIQKLQDHYAGQVMADGKPAVTFDIIDNTHGKGGARLSSMEDLAGQRYNVPEEDLRNAVEGEYQAERISDRVRQGTLGEEGVAQSALDAGDRGIPAQDRAGAGQQPQPQRAGRAPATGAGQGAGLSPDALTTAARGGNPAQPATYINFARIDAPEDIERAIQELADAHAGAIKSAQRGTQSFGDIQLNAGQENAWDILKARRVGQPLNAEQSVATRELWASSANRVTALAQTAVEAPTEANLFAFRKMLSVHNAIQQAVLGARTETARALASWRIPVGTPESRLADVTDQLREAGGGADTSLDLARTVSALAQSNTPDAQLALSKLAEKGAWVRSRDALIQAFSDALLTSPVTQAKILASNVSTALWAMGERKVGSMISDLLGTPNGVAPGEAAAMWSGWIGGFKDALAYGGKALKTGVTGAGIGEPHTPYASAISGDALNLSDKPWLGRAADFIGSMLSIGRRGVAAQHDVALTMGYRAELNAQAVRQATAEVNAGELPEAAFNDRVATLLANPTDALENASRVAAKYRAFLDEPGKVAQWLLDGRRQIPALRIVAPFIKIPARILSYTFERTPLAPLMSEFRAKIAEGGATRDLALAQLAMGTGISMAAADMTMSGNLKGGGPPQKGLEQAEEREGALRDSMRVGDDWLNINGVHPIGKLMLLAADVAEAIQGGQHELKDDADTEKLAVGTTLAIARTLTDSSYFQGFANLFATLHDARVGGAGESAILSTAGSAVPAAVSRVAMAADPYQREVYTLLDEFKSKIPGLSETLPPRRDLFGRAIPNGYGPLTKLLSPVQVSPARHEPIDDEILKQGFNLALPERVQTFGVRGNSVAIDMSHYPAAYSRLLELAGNGLKSPAWGMGLKDLLNAVVTGKSPLSAVYNLKSDGPDGGKEVMVRDLISQYRDQAKAALLKEPQFAALNAAVQEKLRQQQALKLRAAGGR